jgi:hypothetical protein
MSTTITPINKKLSKKEVRKLVYQKLESAFAEFRTSLKEKKFSKNLKKASRLFVADIEKAINKKNTPVKGAKKKSLKPIRQDDVAQV